VCWLAERLGCEPFAVVRAAEVVCHRGDLVTGAGEACARFLDPERCRACCGGSWWSRPRTDDFRNRSDLLVGSLLVATAVFVRTPAEFEPLIAFGALPRSLVLADTEAIAARLLA
jgi:hypothetical protein